MGFSLISPWVLNGSNPDFVTWAVFCLMGTRKVFAASLVGSGSALWDTTLTATGKWVATSTFFLTPHVYTPAELVAFGPVSGNWPGLPHG